MALTKKAQKDAILGLFTREEEMMQITFSHCEWCHLWHQLYCFCRRLQLPFELVNIKSISKRLM
jgi:hypothetical protein